jgi:iron(III) transport system ATP-binding protein
MRASVRADVQRICRRAGTTAVLVTHDQDEALSMADRIAVLRDGRIVQYAAPHDLYTRPVDPALARFVGDANLLPGQLAEPAAAAPGGASAVDTILGRLPLEATSALAASSGPVTVLVRPEQLEIIAAGSAGDAASGRRDCLAGHVVACEYYGHDAVVRVQPEGQADGQAIIVRTAGGPQLPSGALVRIRAHGSVIAWARSA